MSKGKRKANKQKNKKFVNDLIPPKNIKKNSYTNLGKYENTAEFPSEEPRAIFEFYFCSQLPILMLGHLISRAD